MIEILVLMRGRQFCAGVGKRFVALSDGRRTEWLGQRLPLLDVDRWSLFYTEMKAFQIIVMYIYNWDKWRAMVGPTNPGISRRTAIKGAGVGMLGLAGCLGGSGGDGDSGDSNGGQTQSAENKDIGMALAPGGMSGVIMDYLEKDTTILSDTMDEAGYNIEVQRTYDDVTLFGSGQLEFAYPSPIGAARMASQRDINISLLSKNTHMFPAWYTRPGTQFDPAEVGSLQQAIDNLAANGTYGTARWSAGTIPATQAIFDHYGYDLKKQGGDVDLVVGGFEAMDQAVVQGKLDVATGSPMSGAAPDLIADPPKVALVLQIIEEIKNIGLGAPALNSWACRPSFLESDRAAAEALLSAWKEGVNWFFDDAQNILIQEDHFDNISVNSEAGAEYVHEWGIENQYALKEPVAIQDFRWTEEMASNSRSYLERSQELDQLSSGWSDKLTYVQDI